MFDISACQQQETYGTNSSRQAEGFGQSDVPGGVVLSTSLNKQRCQVSLVIAFTNVQVFTSQVVHMEDIFPKCMIEVVMPVPPIS